MICETNLGHYVIVNLIKCRYCIRKTSTCIILLLGMLN